jgi:glycosyltransferase involved in cell wall biosynthesis
MIARRILIPFNTVSLYGMERGVIETFDLLRPEVEPHFLLSLTTRQRTLPVLAEIERRGLECSFFSDKKGWPKIGRPRSLKDAWQMSIAMIRGNLDVLKASRKKDSIYLPSIQYFYFAIFAALIFRLSRKRIIYQFHDLTDRRSVALRLTTFFVTDFVHNTETGRRMVTEANPYLKRKSNFVIPFAVALHWEEENGNNLDNAFPATRNILFVGQVSRHKGVDLLLDAFSVVSRSRSDVALHIVGGCDDPELQKRLRVNGSSRIKYWNYREDVPRLLRMADFLVQPSPASTKESFGRGVAEAMSAGKPVICFRSGALSEMVVHEWTGLVCDEESVECLARNIERLLSDDELRGRCGKQAKSTYERLCSETRVKSLWLDLFRQR